MIANLWDVTDRDIDRFCQSMLKTWLAAGGGLGSCIAEEGGGGTAGEAADEFSGSSGIGCALASSRGACKLPYLIGAAPVCYGVPIGVSWLDRNPKSVP